MVIRLCGQKWRGHHTNLPSVGLSAEEQFSAPGMEISVLVLPQIRNNVAAGREIILPLC